MNREQYQAFGLRFTKVPTWQIVLIVAAVLAIGIALAVVATGIFLIAFPIMLLAGAAYRLFGTRTNPPAASRGPARRDDVIETEYRVIEPGEDARR
ncbi:hypothetical protein GCM10007276_04870 [Agaricicola taiwanensis]|uniref:Uncharacterized protein n=1 Tax=Agaricicola taiwanensis TaxID=591372 RepID=A0A8J2VIG4_9RHOB|nr:hypothetical protein [Agaricicola taiwanensis]GGE30671.1 hypothetical protein GCM10007276_04870 [Agaricicola taiwanensis]